MSLLSDLQGKSEQEAREVGGKIFTFGSYRLGVHGKGVYCMCRGASQVHMYTPCTLLAFTIVAIHFTDKLMTVSCGIEVGHQSGL